MNFHLLLFSKRRDAELICHIASTRGHSSSIFIGAFLLHQAFKLLFNLLSISLQWSSVIFFSSLILKALFKWPALHIESSFFDDWKIAKEGKKSFLKLRKNILFAAVNCHLSMTLIRDSCHEYFINWLTGIFFFSPVARLDFLSSSEADSKLSR